jgi:hypothetical protein
MNEHYREHTEIETSEKPIIGRTLGERVSVLEVLRKQDARRFDDLKNSHHALRNDVAHKSEFEELKDRVKNQDDDMEEVNKNLSAINTSRSMWSKQWDKFLVVIVLVIQVTYFINGQLNKPEPNSIDPETQKILAQKLVDMADKNKLT